MEQQDTTPERRSHNGLIIGWFELVLFLIVAVGAGAFLGKMWASQDDQWIHEQLLALQLQTERGNIKVIDPFRIQKEVYEHGYSAQKVSARIKVYAEEQSRAGVLTIFPSQVYNAPDSLYVSKLDLFPELKNDRPD